MPARHCAASRRCSRWSERRSARPPLGADESPPVPPLDDVMTRVHELWAIWSSLPEPVRRWVGDPVDVVLPVR